jgi:uncharacterized protein YbjQ (UPF0145 family)
MAAVTPHPRADAALQCLAGGPAERHEGRRFSSDLSVDEAVLLKEIGVEPRGLVVGSAVYHIGIQYMNWSNNEELGNLTPIRYPAREDALQKLVQHTTAIGGHGVVGLQLDVRVHGAHGLAEFVAMGPAVSDTTRRATGVWVSDLSGQDLYLLMRAGWVPLGLAFGACVYHIAHQGLSQWLGQQTQNVEMTNYTEALYEARELAMTRMQGEAERLRADGIVAMRIDQQSHVWGSHVIEFLAIGTAVRLAEEQHQKLSPQMVVDLTDSGGAAASIEG